MFLIRHDAPDFKVQFPICTTEKEFISAKKHGIVKEISSQAQAIVQSVQPYRDINFGRNPVNNPLAILHELNIADKHTILPIAVSAMEIQNRLHFYPGTMADTLFKDFFPARWAGQLLRTEGSGTVILKITFRKMHSELNVNADFRYEVAFEKFGTREIEPLIPGLTVLRDDVIKTLDLFSAEF